MGGYKLIPVRKETYNMITQECREEMIKHNPQFQDVTLSLDTIIKRIGRFYLDPKGGNLR